MPNMGLLVTSGHAESSSPSAADQRCISTSTFGSAGRGAMALPRHEFHRAGATLRAPEADDVLAGAGGWILLGVRVFHRLDDALRAHRLRTHAHLAAVFELDGAARLFEERAIPTRRLVVPGADEDAGTEHNRPHRDK